MIKKVILLVDVSNAHYCIFYKNNEWILPFLDNVNSIEEIQYRLKEKYKIDVDSKKIDVIEKTSDYIFVKCQMLNDTTNNPSFDSDIINNLLHKITNELQHNLLFRLAIKIGMELTNDSFWLGIILSVVDKIDNYEIKLILSDFLITYSSSFCDEIIKNGFAGVIDNTNVTIEKIKFVRNNRLKSCPLYDSEKTSKIIESMGIDFDSYVFDCVVFLFNNNILIDINSRMWSNKVEDTDFYNGMILSARNWIKNYIPLIYEKTEKERENVVEKFMDIFNNIHITQKSYATFKLFKNDLNKNEKIYIMQRIGLLKTIFLLSNLFPIRIDDISSENSDLNISRFLIKIKSSLIELLWKDRNQIFDKCPLICKIIGNYPKTISDDFFPINRKCRDNLHYGYYNNLTKADYDILIKYQDEYIKYMISEFEKELVIKFDEEYDNNLFIAKVLNETSNDIDDYNE